MIHIHLDFMDTYYTLVSHKRAPYKGGLHKDSHTYTNNNQIMISVIKG